MTNFAALNQLEIDPNHTEPITLGEIPWSPAPVLMVRPATTSNPAYMNPATKMLGRVRQIARGIMTQEALDAYMAIDRDLYPKHVIVGWRNVQDESGALVPFSREECELFVAALPDWIFARVRLFCGSDDNFAATSFATEETAGN